MNLRPEQVVEAAFDGIQRSSRYQGGVALRFAGVLRYREDKAPDEAETIEAAQSLLQPEHGPDVGTFRLKPSLRPWAS